MGWSIEIKTPGHNKIFQKKILINDLQDSLIGTTIEHSYSGRKNNLDLLQEAEEQEAEEAKDDTDVNADASKINQDD